MLTLINKGTVQSSDGFVVSGNDRFSLKYEDYNGIVTVGMEDGNPNVVLYPTTSRLWSTDLRPTVLGDNEVKLIASRVADAWRLLSYKPMRIEWAPQKWAAEPPRSLRLNKL